MTHTVWKTIAAQIEAKRNMAVATVVEVLGSASAVPGSMAVISEDGQNLCGWIGGGCAESTVIEQSLDAIRMRQPRIVEIDLNDEVLGVGMPCGGHMRVFIDPVVQPKQVALAEGALQSERFRWLLRLAGFQEYQANSAEQRPDYILGRPERISQTTSWTNVRTIESPLGHLPAEDLGEAEESMPVSEQAFYWLARLVAADSGASSQPLATRKEFGLRPSSTLTSDPLSPNPVRLLIVGHSRISEQLALLASQLNWSVLVSGQLADSDDYPNSVCRIQDDNNYELREARDGDHVVVATQHKGDHLILRSILSIKPAYIGLIASSTRTKLIAEFLEREGLMEAARSCLSAPAGLDLGGRTPFEIALGIVCEIIGRTRRVTLL